MKKTLALLALLSAGSAFAGNGQNGPKVWFNADCKWGNADVQDGDIEFSKLNLDLQADQWFKSKRCEIKTEFPGRPGKQLVVSVFKVEGIADLKPQQGAAIVTVRHNFKNWGWKAAEARAVKPGVTPLVAQATAIGIANCGEPVVLNTEILTAARNATVLQDAAAQTTTKSKIKYSYENCH